MTENIYIVPFYYSVNIFFIQRCCYISPNIIFTAQQRICAPLLYLHDIHKDWFTLSIISHDNKPFGRVVPIFLMKTARGRNALICIGWVASKYIYIYFRYILPRFILYMYNNIILIYKYIGRIQRAFRRECSRAIYIQIIK